MTVISLASERDRRAEEVWACYTAARQAAECSGAITDGIAAGHAWREWLDLFQSPQQREDGRETDRVLQLRRRS